MERQRLDRLAAKRTFKALKGAGTLGPVHVERIDALLELDQEDGKIRMDAALGACYPDQNVKAAQVAFRKLREKLRDAADEAGVRFSLEVDTRKRTSPAGRRCWFTGEDRVSEAASRHDLAASANVDPNLSVRQNAHVYEYRDDKPLIRYFVSYAHRNRKLKDELMERLQARLDNAAEFVFEPWDDDEILPGDVWREEIEQAIERCHFGLLLLSLDFLRSRFITVEELPRFVPPDPELVGGSRRAIPVGLSQVAMDGSINLKGLQHRQIFRYQKERFFSQQRGEGKEKFAEELFQQILRIARRGIEAQPPEPEPVPVRRKRDHKEIFAEHQLTGIVDGEDLFEFVPTEGYATSLEKMPERVDHAGQRRDALEFLLDWAGDDKAPSFCALLGDYGIGKTTTCKVLTQRLLELRESDPNLPLPIYIDLRHLGDISKSNPTLTTIIDTVLERTWQSGPEAPELQAAEIIRMVRDERAVVLFDGLDEVLVHLSPAGGQAFTRELWRIMPPRMMVWRGRLDIDSPMPGKLLISCRTHYFRTLRDQQTHLTAEDRDGIRAADYRALVLLPFSEQQVQEYLEKNVPDQPVERLLELIREVHNLPEMAERPYTLSLIARHLPQIEQWKLEGRKVTGVLLYRHMVRSWLERDTGKHQLTPDHKQQLMEVLAAELHRAGSRTWNVTDLEQWLVDFLQANPGIAAHYPGINPELLKEDLRTATFLIRSGDDDFRFAHTSLQEFFLAAFLQRALNQGRVEELAMPIPSLETLEFLGQLLEADGADKAEPTMRQIRGSYRQQASELVLRYALLARTKSLPAPAIAGFDLTGARLKGWRFEGEPGNRINLRGSILRNADLVEAWFEQVDLSDADLTGADLTRAELHHIRAKQACFRSAQLAGSIFRNADLDETDLDEAELHRTQVLHSRLNNTHNLDRTAPRVFLACCEPIGRPYVKGFKHRLTALTGHRRGISACDTSPDGRWIVTADYDGIVRLWDVSSGDQLLQFTAHQLAIYDCAFSPDNRRIATAGEDKTLRIWDADSGKQLQICSGHQAPIRTCAFSPDSRRITSAGSDNLRLWDADTGELLLTYSGHTGWIWSCAFSPNGRRIASADDRTLRLWDANTGDQLLFCSVHQAPIYACAFSPDGRRIASAGYDKTLRLWDADTGDLLHTFYGHKDWIWCCAFSPDGRRIASAGYDKTLRLWDADTGDLLLQFTGHQETIWAFAFLPDGRRIATVSSDKTLRLWDVDSGDQLLQFAGHQEMIRVCAFSPDGRRIASVSSGKTLRLWDADTGKNLLTSVHQAMISACAFSPDGRRIALGGYETLRLWDADTSDLILTIPDHQVSISSCAFSPDGRRIASAGNDQTLRLWDADTGNHILTISGHQACITACAFSPDSLRIASAGKALRLWDAESGDALLTCFGHQAPIRACAFSPDGRRIASAGDDLTIRLWDAESGDALLTCFGHQATILSCAFSPDGRRIASAGSNGTLRLWDSVSGDQLLACAGHQATILCCAFSPDGRRIVTASSDHTLRIWDVEQGCETGFRVHILPDDEYAVLTPDGQGLIEVSPGAWRWLGWLGKDPETGKVTRYPAEIFGPLPVKGEKP